jgi:hypothetical protein
LRRVGQTLTAFRLISRASKPGLGGLADRGIINRNG